MDPLVIVDVVTIAALFAGVMWLAGSVRRSRSSDRRKSDELAVEPDSVLANAEVTVSWSSGTRADWDRHVRPVVAREFQNIVGGRRAGSSSLRATGELMFGPDLWPLVDPAGHYTDRLGSPGPGRDALDAILAKLEAA